MLPRLFTVTNVCIANPTTAVLFFAVYSKVIDDRKRLAASSTIKGGSLRHIEVLRVRGYDDSPVREVPRFAVRMKDLLSPSFTYLHHATAS